MKTRTGNYPIGVRRGGSPWQKDFDGWVAWAKESGLEVLDVGRDGDEIGPQVVAAGLRVGTIDMKVGKEMISPNASKRKDAVARNAEYIAACAGLGELNYFLVMLPEDPGKSRKENFGYMVESFTELAPVLEQHKARIVIEGWPGPGALCCTPEGFRAFFRECSSAAMGINYDPSHLVRMQIDPLRFLKEFVNRVYHIHGKDTEILDENLYEYGNLQPATFAQNFRYGGLSWRYTIPGQGCTRWSAAFQILADAGYKGAVTVELEDHNFNGKEDTEKEGILLGVRFLAGC